MDIETGFGWIEVDFERFEEDIVMNSDGRIILRPKHLSSGKKKIYGHTPFTLDELRYIIAELGDPEILIIGTGQYGAMPVEKEVEDYLSSKGIKLIIEKTPKAIEIYKSYLGEKKVIAVFHLTC